MGTTRHEIRKSLQNRKSEAFYDAALCILIVMPQNMINLLDLPPDVVSDIESMRADDDSVGRSAAYFGFLISNYRMKPQDAVVAGSVLHVAASNVLAGSVALEKEYDKKDVLLNPAYASKLAELITDTSNVAQVSGDRIAEELAEIKEYIEQYDSSVKDQTQRWVAGGGGTNEDETGTRLNWFQRFIDGMPGIGQ